MEPPPTLCAVSTWEGLPCRDPFHEKPNGIGAMTPSTRSLPNLHAYACLMVAVVCWGVEYPLMKQATEAVGFWGTGAVMFSISAVLLGLTLAGRRLFGRRENVVDVSKAACASRYPIRAMLLVGVIGIAVNVLGLWAIKLTRVVNVATLARADALFSLVLSAWVFGEVVARRVWFFVPLMLCGIGLLTGFLLNPLEIGNAGDYLILASAFGVALNAYVIKKAVQHASGLAVGCVNSTMIGLFFVIVVALQPQGVWQNVSHEAKRALLLLGFLAYLFFASYNAALRSIPVWKVRLVCLLIPVVAALTAWAWFGDQPSGLQVLGMGLILAGAAGIIVARDRSVPRGTVSDGVRATETTDSGRQICTG